MAHSTGDMLTVSEYHPFLHFDDFLPEREVDEGILDILSHCIIV